MIAVIFEVWPAEGERGCYLDIAARLRPLLDSIDGFISIERFVSLSEPEKLLSLSFWRDEASVAAWRNQLQHRATQKAGRAGLFIGVDARHGQSGHRHKKHHHGRSREQGRQRHLQKSDVRREAHAPHHHSRIVRRALRDHGVNCCLPVMHGAG